MTGLGAALYGGFFGVAAPLWLYLTADRDPLPPDQPQRADRSNSDSASATESGSMPCWASHSSRK